MDRTYAIEAFGRIIGPFSSASSATDCGLTHFKTFPWKIIVLMAPVDALKLWSKSEGPSADISGEFCELEFEPKDDVEQQHQYDEMTRKAGGNPATHSCPHGMSCDIHG